MRARTKKIFAMVESHDTHRDVVDPYAYREMTSVAIYFASLVQCYEIDAASRQVRVHASRLPSKTQTSELT